MNEHVRSRLLVIVCAGWLGCSSGSSNSAAPVAGGAGAPAGSSAVGSVAGHASAAGGGGTAVGSAGTTAVVAGRSGGAAGNLAAGSGAGIGGAAGAPASAGTSGGAAGTAAIGGAGGAAGSAGMTAGGAGGSTGTTGNDLSGMLGALGPVKPVMNGWATTNGLETLIYLSSSPLSCAMMMTKGVKWLASLPAGTQVIEIVVRGTAMVGTTPVGSLQGEVNYAEGSKSSSTEVNATGGSIMFTKADSKKLFEGMVMATYANGNLMGKFHADWCEGGTEY